MAKAPEGVRWVRDQLQGLLGHAGVGHGLLAHRTVGDDQEDLGLREAEEARRQALIPSRANGRRAARFRRAAFFCTLGANGRVP